MRLRRLCLGGASAHDAPHCCVCRNRSGCQNITLAITSSDGVPCRHGHAPSLPPELWERTPPEVRAYIGALEARIVTLEAMVQPYRSRCARCRSSSTRPPATPPVRRRAIRRSLHVPVARGGSAVVAVNRAIPAIRAPWSQWKRSMRWSSSSPSSVSGCQAPLSGDDATPFRHQVIEIPPIKPVITEYQWHQLVCPACGETTRAPWPAGVPSGTYGPRVHATVALCTGVVSLVQAHDGSGDGRLCSVCR